MLLLWLTCRRNRRRWVEDVVAGERTVRGEGVTTAVADATAHQLGASLFGTASATFVANATAPAAFALAVLASDPVSSGEMVHGSAESRPTDRSRPF